MNQILVTEKLYITPELRRKKKRYKMEFFLSVLFVCLLSSYYIYAEIDRGKSEEVSQEILSQVMSPVQSNEDTTTRKSNDNVIIVAIEDDEDLDQQIITQPPKKQSNTKEYTTASGVTYHIESVVNIERLGINYPIITETSEELLKISLNKYWGPSPNEIGNYCVVGHNYKNKKMFGRLNEIVNGDIVELTDMDGNLVRYSVYDKYIVEPTDVSCTSQLTGGKREVTLITCTNYGQQRLVVKAREIK